MMSAYGIPPRLSARAQRSNFCPWGTGSSPRRSAPGNDRWTSFVPRDEWRAVTRTAGVKRSELWWPKARSCGVAGFIRKDAEGARASLRCIVVLLRILCDLRVPRDDPSRSRFKTAAANLRLEVNDPIRARNIVPGGWLVRMPGGSVDGWATDQSAWRLA